MKYREGGWDAGGHRWGEGEGGEDVARGTRGKWRKSHHDAHRW